MLSGICILISKFKKLFFLRIELFKENNQILIAPLLSYVNFYFQKKSRINAQDQKMGPTRSPDSH